MAKQFDELCLLDGIVHSTNVDLHDMPPAIRVLLRKGYSEREREFQTEQPSERTFFHWSQNARVCDEDVKFSELVNGGLNGPRDFLGVCDVHGERQNLCAWHLLQDGGLHRVQSRLLARDERQERASTSIGQRRFLSDTTRGTSDEDDFAFICLGIVVDLAVYTGISTESIC